MNYVRSVLPGLFLLIIGMVIMGAISIPVMYFTFHKRAEWVSAFWTSLAMFIGYVIWVLAMEFFKKQEEDKKMCLITETPEEILKEIDELLLHPMWRLFEKEGREEALLGTTYLEKGDRETALIHLRAARDLFTRATQPLSPLG